MRPWPIALAAAAATLAGCVGGDGSPGFFPTRTPEPALSPAVPTMTPRPATPADLAHAWETYRLGEYERARDEFAAVAAGSETETTQRSEALLGAAVAGEQAGDTTTAALSLRAAHAEAPEGSEVGRQAVYLLGVRLNGTGDHEGAREALEPLADDGASDPLRPFILNEYAEALAATGDRDTASATWDTILAEDAPAPLVEEVYRMRADAAGDAGDLQVQLEWLDHYIAATGDAGARLERAGVLAALGDQAGNVAALREVVRRHAISPAALAALELLQGMDEAVDPGLAGLVYYRRERYDDAVAVLEPAVADTSVSPEDRAFRLYFLAAAREGRLEFETAISHYEAAAATGASSSPYVHRAKWWAARLTEDTGDTAGAAARYLDLALNGPEGEFSADARFRAGYALLRGGDPQTAIATWNLLGETEDSRILYWRGRAHAAAGDAGAARTSLEAAVAAAPNDFHGLAAAEELSGSGEPGVDYEPLATPPPIDWAALEGWLATFVPGTPVIAADTAAAAALVTVGEREAAEALILEDGGDDAWALLARVRQAHELGMTDTALELATRLRKMTAGGPEPPIDLLRLEYPLSYVSLLDSAGRAYGLDPLLLAAIIRQESLWDPQAGSSAGALGLMQVIPPTGLEIAEALDVDGFAVDDLFRPSVAIPFGAYYIDRQLDAFDDVPAALAAYNGGPSNAARWLEAAPSDRAADFVETVDYSETQLYVVLVLEHYAMYRAAWR